MHKFKRHNIERENKFLFGDHDLSNIAVVERINRYPLPTTSIRDIEIAGKHGKRLSDNRLGIRTIHIQVRFIEETYEKVQERVIELASLLYSKQPQKLFLRDSPLYNYAIMNQSTPVEKSLETGSAEITFMCHDPFNYGDEITETLGSATTLINEGFETEGIFELKTTGGNVKVTLNNQEFILIYGGFSANQNLIIDTEKELVTVDGNIINKDLDFESDFFSIPSGNFEIKLQGATGKLIYKERWI